LANIQKPTINQVTVTVPDAIASNGVVHVIGDTLFPVPVGTIFDVLDNCTSFSKFRDYVVKAGLQEELKNIGTCSKLQFHYRIAGRHHQVLKSCFL